ncbi:hypothetical protein NHX12_027083 [Muraenolepis orangiensis]|uniref:Uncharacterized protein n=1 Tax=Muraenolepis orangiensis TaxID=630683 RepID=A0A9Q0EBR1_9TELE|nr:hypothetical protein NHX12_027083 [Muraenolepis orangiensis]
MLRSIGLRDINESAVSASVDMLWSDPMAQDGCVPNLLLIRSPECKQDGYEFCRIRSARVLTIFSASNYYEVGSNRGGAYIYMGPDLVPHFIQYQSSQTGRELSLRRSIGRTERSALCTLREQMFAHKSDLLCAFQQSDPYNIRVISLNHWARAMEGVLKLGLSWRVLHSQLGTSTQDGMLDYQEWVQELLSNTSILETMYRNYSNLETIFRIIGTDHSVLIVTVSSKLSFESIL